jgi:hypothetical protein
VTGNDWNGISDPDGTPRDDAVPFNPFDEGTPEHAAWNTPPPTHWECAKHQTPKLVAIGEQCEVCGADQTGDDNTETLRSADADDLPVADAVVDIRLPDEFWQARPFLEHVRAAARARRAHPDAVLGAALARISAMIPHALKFDSLDDGSEPDGSMNLFCCLLAPSGVGKSRAAATAEKLIVVPAFIADGAGRPDWERFRCGVGIGSGEGLIEAYMGTAERDLPGFHEKGPNKGQPLTERFRTQVRHHAFVYVDEGETLNRLLNERRGSTLGGTIRSAWGGGTLGQANAAAETTRHLDAGGYALGILVGYQVSTAAAMLKDAGPGTPQRFLWFGAQDTQMTNRRFPWPGPLKLPEWVSRATVTFHPDIVQALVDYDVAKHRREVVVAELDSHEPLMWCKLAALFALIDGRYTVNLDDWQLAKTVYLSSTQIRAALETEIRRQRDAEKAERREDLAADDQARKQASERVVRVGRWIARKAAEYAEANSGEGLHWPEWRKKTKSGEDRKAADAARDHAEAQGWIVVEGDTIFKGRNAA